MSPSDLHRLSQDQLRAAWQCFQQLPPHPDTDGAVQDLIWAAETPTPVLRTPDAQRRLWTMRRLGTAGGSENLAVLPLLTDEELVTGLLNARSKAWAPAVNQRAEALQIHHNKLLKRVAALLPRSPRARLLRALMALVPGDLAPLYTKPGRSVLAHLVLGQRQPYGEVFELVTVRQRIADFVGRPKTPRDHVQQLFFCRWMVEHAEVLSRGELPEVDGTDSPATEPLPETDAPLELWSRDRQAAFLFTFKGGMDALTSILREATTPASMAELAQAVQDDLKYSSFVWVQRILRNLRTLDLLQSDAQGSLSTSDAGHEILDGGTPDQLISNLIIRYRGFGYLLYLLKHEPQTLSDLRTALAPALNVAETSVNNYSSSRFWWSRLTGLTAWNKETKQLSLTERGRTWAAMLPAMEDIQVVPQDTTDSDLDELSSIDVDTPPAPPTDAAPYPTFAQLHAALAADDGFLFDKADLRAVHTAWTFHSHKRFVLLSGLSGTGKTQLVLRYAHAVCQQLDLPPQRHIALVPVRPDWRDPTGLLGYFNALHSEPTYAAEPATRLLVRAVQDPHRPYFLLLDEMNLARVERYFAPLLSAMETPDQPLHLHAHEESVNGVPPSLPHWPANLHIAGTVNMDETTHPFSDKVLDRAFTLSFWHVDTAGFLAQRNLSAGTPLHDELLHWQVALTPLRRHVGYRALGEICDFVTHAIADDPTEDPLPLLDHALFAKILPRLRGSRSAVLTATLQALAKHTKARLPRCHAKLAQMQAQLAVDGVAGFWG